MSALVKECTTYCQDEFLENLSSTREPVNIFLINGIRLHGIVGGYDQHTVLLESVSTQIVYKHAISTIMLAKGQP
ncbi:MAG: RNA chaperone Hfq [Gammaproteobacteria bacterium RIFCSPHIGHO2_12_FULL_35_23]|nr:MAG: RNA chaperone Hfq [Gammaproteobacteria bacterium RIFCSPHIGHO2_12_FULL_35_23]